MALPTSLHQKLTLPFFAAPMFLCSGVELAIACCKAGVIGSLTRNHCRDLEELEQQLRDVREALNCFAESHPHHPIGPLSVNISPNGDPSDFRAHLEVCQKYGAEIIVTSVGNPTQNAPLVRDHGLLHFHDATTIRFAEKAIAAGVDGIVCIGAGGGGHAGTISHLAFIPAVRSMFDGTIVMAGAISNGGALRAAEALGADLAYVGTRLIATQESAAPDAYKHMLVEAGITDILYTKGVNGMAASWLTASLRSIGLDPDNLIIPESRSTEHLPEGKTPWRDIWSGGQGAALIADIPSVKELIQRFQREYIEACTQPTMVTAAQAALARA